MYVRPYFTQPVGKRSTFFSGRVTLPGKPVWLLAHQSRGYFFTACGSCWLCLPGQVQLLLSSLQALDLWTFTTWYWWNNSLNIPVKMSGRTFACYFTALVTFSKEMGHYSQPCSVQPGSFQLENWTGLVLAASTWDGFTLDENWISLVVYVMAG